jgi:hypothetical protein
VDAGAGGGVDLYRLGVAAQAPHEVPGVDLRDVHEQPVVVGHRRLRRGEDLVGLAVAAQLVQRLAQQQTGLGGDPVDHRGPAEALDRGEVLAVACEARGPHQQVRVGRARRVQAGGGDADGIFPAAGAIGLGAGGVLQQEPAAGEGRHAGPEDLAVERVGQAHLLAAALGAHGQEPAPVEELELAGADDGLQGGQAGRLPHGQDVDGAAGRLGQPGETPGQQLVQPGCGHQRADEPPHAPLVDEVAAVERP